MGRELNEIVPELDSVNVNRGEQLYKEYQQEVNQNLASEDPEAANTLELNSFFEDSLKSQFHVKKLGLVVKDLTVVGLAASASDISTNSSFVKSLWPPNWFHKEEGTFHILNKITFMCKPGEMLLVLGRPGAGCSSLLRVMANQRRSFVDVQGEVNYGGIPAQDFHRYVGESIYTPEEDLHSPTLTLKQTLTFALRNKTPGTSVRDEGKRRSFRNKMFELLSSMFGIKKQANTLVGNEWVRGLSGGERKRLTIAEAMVAQGSIYAWDCPTRGLDAASATDYVKSVRLMTNTLSRTSIVTMYQASDAMFDLFDRVLLLDKGRCMYYGPAKAAKQYFIDMGFVSESRKTVPDFLTGLSNPQERIAAPGFEARVPTTSVEFERVYKQSPTYENALNEIRDFERDIDNDKPSQDFIKMVETAKASGAKKQSKYMVSLWIQLQAMISRQMRLIQGNTFELAFKYVTVVLQAVIYGSVFFDMPLDANGGFLRGGALFGAIFLGFYLSMAELPNVYVDRMIIGKHKSYGMYHPMVFHLSQVVWDFPLIFIQSLLFSVIAYWMYGLDPVASKFFIFLFMTMLTAMVTAQLFRAIGNLTPNMLVSTQIVGVIIVFMTIFIDFLLPYSKAGGWVVWIYWINPIFYSFRVFFINEMNGLVFDCSGAASVPYGPEYNNSAYRVCNLPGAGRGAASVTGNEYMKAVYNYDADDITINAIAVFLWWIGLTIVNLLAVEFIQWSKGGFTRKVFKKGFAPDVNDEEFEKAQQKNMAKMEGNMSSALKLQGGVFVWDHINYTVPVDKGTRQLLNELQGWIKPQQMTALMGSSGAGKTTLLDVLAQRKTQGKVDGTMILNGQPLQIDFERITGYVEQMDVHNPFLTVREALQFSAKLRQEPEVPLEEKYEYVEQVLDMMEMKHLGEALIGDLTQGIGLSVEERKRLTIGMELVAKPHILFLDEPTSGLDAQSAYNIVKFIRKLADAGMPLVCTIHQPSALLFEYFDRLLLLQRGGKTVYFGDIGENSHTMLDYFESNGARKFDEAENPAEYILEAIGAGTQAQSTQDWGSVWEQSPEKQAVGEEIARLVKEAPKHPRTDAPREFATSVWYQFVEVYKRLNLVFWRNPEYNVGRVFQGLVIGLATGFSFWKISNSTSDIMLYIFAVFLLMMLAINMISTTQTQFMVMRDLFKRDYASKYYSTIPFAVSMIFVELPYLIIIATGTFVSLYWSTGIDTDAISGFYMWLMVIAVLFFGVSFGQVIAAMVPNMMVAFVFLPFIETFLLLFAGLLIPYNAMPKFWRSWMYHINPIRYFLEGTVTTVLAPLKIECSAGDWVRFDVPEGETCGSYMQPFFDAGGAGYVEDENDFSSCGYCKYASGEEYFTPLTWDVNNRWRNFGILMAFWLFNVSISGIFIYLNRKQKR